MKNKFVTLCNKVRYVSRYFYHPTTPKVLGFIASIFVLAISIDAFAGTDILDGTEDDLVATLNGTGKKYMYLIEGILAIAGYMKTKNLLLLAGIILCTGQKFIKPPPV